LLFILTFHICLSIGSESRVPSVDTIESSAKSTSSRPKPVPKQKRSSTKDNVTTSSTRSLSFDDTVITLKNQTKMLDASIDTLKALINSSGGAANTTTNTTTAISAAAKPPNSPTTNQSASSFTDAFKAVAFDSKAGNKSSSDKVTTTTATTPAIIGAGMNRLKAASQQINTLNTFNVMTAVNGEDKLRAKRLKDMQLEEEAGDEMDAVMTGDIIMLENTDPDTAGMLMGDRAFKRLGVQGHSWCFGRTSVKREKTNGSKSENGSLNGKYGPKGERPISRSLDDAAFRIIPKLK
jgi:hypothetical protein